MLKAAAGALPKAGEAFAAPLPLPVNGILVGWAWLSWSACPTPCSVKDNFFPDVRQFYCLLAIIGSAAVSR